MASGDLDGDAEITREDAVRFGECLTGPGGTPSPSCGYADADGDGDLDFLDLAGFHTLLE